MGELRKLRKLRGLRGLREMGEMGDKRKLIIIGYKAQETPP